MTSSVLGRLISRRKTLAILGLWAGLFLLLLLTLQRWSLRMRCDEPHKEQIITEDSSTLVAFSVRLRRAQRGYDYYPTWPIRLFDLATGHERVLTRPEDPAEPAEFRDEMGTVFRAAGRQTLHTTDEENGVQQSGDYLALTYETIDEDIPEKRLQVLNWRSGDVLLDAPFEGTCRFFGPRLLVSQHEGGARLEIWTPEERTIKRADRLSRYQDLDSTIVSPDGRWLILRGSTGLWDLARGEERLKLPTGIEDAVFSPDGSQLVFVDRFARGEPGRQIRRWKCLDTQSGAVLREEQEVLEWPDNRSPPRGPGDLYFLSDDQTVHYDQRGGATEWSPQGLQRLEQSEEVALENLLDDPWSVAWAADNKWAVVTLEQSPGRWNLYHMVASLLLPNQALLNAPFSYQLWNLEDHRQVALLGRGSAESCRFTPDSLRVVTRTDDELLVWEVPPGRPWGRAAVWSCTVPLAALFWSLGRRALHLRSSDRSQKRGNSAGRPASSDEAQC